AIRAPGHDVAVRSQRQVVRAVDGDLGDAFQAGYAYRADRPQGTQPLRLAIADLAVVAPAPGPDGAVALERHGMLQSRGDLDDPAQAGDPHRRDRGLRIASQLAARAEGTVPQLAFVV